MSSRLFQTVREQLGLAYSVYSFQDSYRDCGVFGFYIGTDPRSARRALQASGKELVLLKRGQLTKAEVASAKEQLKGQLVLGLEGTSSRMNRLARQELYTGKHVTLEETLGLIDRVSRDDLVALANDLVHFDRMTAVALGPLESGFFRGFDWTTLG
jgi:predicted Zn-dependent peptidase